MNKTQIAIAKFAEANTTRKAAEKFGVSEEEVLRTTNMWIAMTDSEQEQAELKATDGKAASTKSGSKSSGTKATKTKATTLPKIGVISVVTGNPITHARGKQAEVQAFIESKEGLNYSVLFEAGKTGKASEDYPKFVELRKEIAEKFESLKSIGLQRNYTLMALERILNEVTPMDVAKAAETPVSDEKVDEVAETEEAPVEA